MSFFDGYPPYINVPNNMDNQAEKVKLFHHLSGHPVSDKLTILTTERAASRADWMKEEVDEFMSATANGDLAGAIDALGDLLYFTFGTAVEMGATYKLRPVFDAIHKANLTKFPTTQADADRTIADYADKGINTYSRQVEFWPYVFYVVYFSDGAKAGKVAKFVDWKKPDFTDIL